MHSPAQLFRLLTEIVFLLAGVLLIFVGLTGRYMAAFDAGGLSWRILAVILMIWGLRGLRQSRLIAVRNLRVAAWLGGASLIAVGAIMFSLAWVQLGDVGSLLAVAGTIFVARGLGSAAILALAR